MDLLQPVRLQHAAHPLLHDVLQLYQAAFPATERRKPTQLLQLLTEPDMQVHGFLSHGRFAGFCIHWPFPEFLFVEHLAVEPALRGKGLGQQAVRWLQQQAPGRLVLEVEPPATETSCQRIAFYQKLGLELHESFAYQQPPYTKHGQPVPLRLMSDPMVPAAALPSIATTIRQQVYHRFYT